MATKRSFLRVALLLMVSLCLFFVSGSLAHQQISSSAASSTSAASACVDKCASRKLTCRQPHEIKLNACTALHGCDKTYCPGNYACRFGCAMCKSYWNHYLNECDRTLVACKTRCTTAAV